MNDLGKRILKFRAKTGMTQKDLARDTHMSHVTIAALEQGKPVTPLTETKMEVYLDEHNG